MPVQAFAAGSRALSHVNRREPCEGCADALRWTSRSPEDASVRSAPARISGSTDGAVSRTFPREPVATCLDSRSIECLCVWPQPLKMTPCRRSLCQEAVYRPTENGSPMSQRQVPSGWRRATSIAYTDMG